jgi:hypothetical protein
VYASCTAAGTSRAAQVRGCKQRAAKLQAHAPVTMTLTVYRPLTCSGTASRYACAAAGLKVTVMSRASPGCSTTEPASI